MILSDEEVRAIADTTYIMVGHAGPAGALEVAIRATERAVLERLAEPLIRACLPGGDVCDPQQVADAIREYFAALRALDSEARPW